MPGLASLAQVLPPLKLLLELLAVLGLSLSLLDDFFVDHDYKGAFLGLLTEFRAVSEEHRDLVGLYHAIGEKELFSMDWL